MPPLRALLLAAVVVSAVAAVQDLRTGRIANGLTLGALALAPIAHAVLALRAGAGAVGALVAAGWSLGGAIACAAVPLLLWRAGAMGGGDVKLLAAVGAICHPAIGVEAEMYAFVAAALFAPARMAYEGKLLATLGNTFALVANPLLPKHKRRELSPEMMTSLRFGPAVLLGAGAAALVQWR